MRTLLALLLTVCSLAALAQDTPPKISLKLDKPNPAAGATVKGTLTVTFLDGLHGYQNPASKPELIPVAVVSNDPTTKLTKVEYPKGVDLKMSGESEAVKVYEGTIKIPVTFKMPDKPGAFTLKVKLTYQQCTDSNCFAPNKVETSLKVTLGKKNGEEPSEAVTYSVAGPEKAPPTTSANTAAEDDSFIAKLIRDGFAQKNYLVIFLACVLTGLALALTPCVYPVIPITVSFFSGQSGGSRSGRVGLGLMYMLGIAITYGAVGGIAASLGGAVGGLFTKPWFLLSLAAFMFVLALSMFDVYQIGIPGPIARHLKGRSGPVGALIMGLLVGFAAAPCAGAFVTSFAIEVARIGEVAAGFLVFTAIGVGLGLPFVVIGAMAAGSKALPKSGGWLKTVKAILGIVVLWIAADYLLKGLGFKPDEARTMIAWTVFFVAGALYLFAFENSGNTRLIIGIKGAAVLVLGLCAGLAWSGYGQIKREAEINRLAAESGKKVIPTKVDWVKFTPEAFEEAKKSGKAIVIDGTADWCLVCKEIDEAVFKKPASIFALQEVVTFKIDLSTGVDPAYESAVRKQFNIVGLPQIMVFKPGGELSRQFTDIKQLSSPEILIDALKQAGATL